MNRSVVVGVAAMTMFGLSACGSSGFTGSVKLQIMSFDTDEVRSSDNGATCTVSKLASGTVALKDASDKIVSIGDVGPGTAGPPITLSGKTYYASCKDIPVTFSDVPAGAGPYQMMINNGNPKLLTQQQLEEGSVTLSME